MKYNLPNLDLPKYKKPQKRKREEHNAETQNNTPATKVPRGSLTLKTYDHDSGVCMKFKTDRGAEVGRLIGGLSTLGRHMAAIPQRTEGMIIFIPNIELHQGTKKRRYYSGHC